MQQRAGGIRIGGLTVRAEWAFFPVIALLGYRGRSSLEMMQWLVLAGAMVAVFEYGHALAERRARSGLLVGVGGSTHEPPKPSWSRARSALAGPMATLLLGVPAWALVAVGALDAAPGLRSMMVDVAVINMAWSLFNLLPLLPLDGGRALARATSGRIACEFGIVVGLSGALISSIMGVVPVAVLLGSLGFLNLLAIIGLGARSPAPAEEIDRPAPTRRVRRRSQPARRRLHLCASEPDPPIIRPMTERRASASGMIELWAWNALRSGKVKEAVRIASRSPDPVVQCAYLSASLAVVTGDPVGVPAMVDAMLGAFDPPNLVVAQVVAEAGIATVLAETLLSMPDGTGSEAAVALQAHLQASECGWAAAEVAQARLMHGPVTAPVAFEAACCWAAVGNPDRALALLSVAVGAGMTSTDLIDTMPILAPVRSLEAFPLVRARLA